MKAKLILLTVLLLSTACSNSRNPHELFEDPIDIDYDIPFEFERKVGTAQYQLGTQVFVFNYVVLNGKVSITNEGKRSIEYGVNRQLLSEGDNIMSVAELDLCIENLARLTAKALAEGTITPSFPGMLN